MATKCKTMVKHPLSNIITTVKHPSEREEWQQSIHQVSNTTMMAKHPPKKE
jgi:hypothetical protein